MLESNSSSSGPGSGVLPAEWLDGASVGREIRAIGREGNSKWLANSPPQGFEPLRHLIQQRLSAFNIVANADQVVLTTGITQSLDLTLRCLVRPGDTVLTMNPSWFGTYGVLANHNVNVIGVDVTEDGPDLIQLRTLLERHHPRLLILSSAAQNPTGLSFSPHTVKKLIEITEPFEIPIFEDDAYADLCESNVLRLAAENQLERVIYAGSFSKTLASNLRVGFLACGPSLADHIAETKILSGFTTPELNERVVHELLLSRRHRNFIAGLKSRLAESRDSTRRLLDDAGVDILGNPVDGLFFWINARQDTNELALKWREKGVLLAPGGLFSPSQSASEWMRWNVTSPAHSSLVHSLRQR